LCEARGMESVFGEQKAAGIPYLIGPETGQTQLPMNKWVLFRPWSKHYPIVLLYRQLPAERWTSNHVIW
jgi:hypothetical protein